jgi:hypothetical protein
MADSRILTSTAVPGTLNFTALATEAIVTDSIADNPAGVTSVVAVGLTAPLVVGTRGFATIAGDNAMSTGNI